jgi:GTP-binding protein HflX
MLIDTVGLVRRLPHGLVEAFKSTLEEAALSDIILNVCDASSDEAQVHTEVTAELLAELGCGDTPIINVYNKCDKLSPLEIGADNEKTVHISAREGKGIDKLLEAIDNNLPVRIKKVKLLVPFSMGNLSSEIREKATLISENYTADGIEIEAVIDEEMYRKLKDYILD